MLRRNFLKLVAGSSIASPLAAMAQYNTSPGLPASPTGIVVLELANFHCSRSNAVNKWHARIKEQAHAVGIDFRFAPVAWGEQSLWPDRVYYAMRDLYPEATGLLRDMLFEGIQESGMRFENPEQVFAYMERKRVTEEAYKLYPHFKMIDLLDRAQSDETMFAEAKAARLMLDSGAQEAPVFIWVFDSAVQHVVTPAGDLSDPRKLALTVIQSLKETSFRK